MTKTLLGLLVAAGGLVWAGHKSPPREPAAHSKAPTSGHVRPEAADDSDLKTAPEDRTEVPAAEVKPLLDILNQVEQELGKPAEVGEAPARPDENIDPPVKRP